MFRLKDIKTDSDRVIKRYNDLTFVIDEYLPKPNPHNLSLKTLLDQIKKYININKLIIVLI